MLLSPASSYSHTYNPELTWQVWLKVLLDIEEMNASCLQTGLIRQPRQDHKNQDAVKWFSEDGLMTSIHDPVKVQIVYLVSVLLH